MAFFADKKNKKAKIASELKISRQNLYNYISGETTPSSEVLAKICRLPGVCLKIGGKEISARDLIVPRRHAEADYQQIPLPFDQPIVLISEDGNVSVEVTRMPAAAVEFRVSIKSAS